MAPHAPSRQPYWCDGFRMPAPSLSMQHALRPPGRRSKAASEGNRRRAGTPIDGRYGNCAGADDAAEVMETGMGGNGWDEPVHVQRG